MKSWIIVHVVALLIVAGRYGSGEPALGQEVEKPLPVALASVLSDVKAETSMPILLPTELPKPFSDAEHAVVAEAEADEYAVVLYYELGRGDAGFAASFQAQNNARYSPRELPNVQEVKLARGIIGFFRPVSCGGSCAPANIWWEQGATLYQIQLKLPPTLGGKKQQKIITQVANSAILAGPR